MYNSWIVLQTGHPFEEGIVLDAHHRSNSHSWALSSRLYEFEVPTIIAFVCPSAA